MSAAARDVAGPANDLCARVAAVGPDWIVPQWAAPHGVRAFFTTRNVVAAHGTRVASFDVGGASNAAADPAARNAVASSRRCLDTLLPSSPVWLDQVHGAAVVDVARALAVDGRWPRADAAVTRADDVVLAIRVADCLPALFAASDGSVIGAAHAGWRGLAAGVLENTVAAMRSNPAGIVAWLGPCIGASAYEVGDDVRDAFVARDAESSAAFERARAGKWQADLRALARRRLVRAGVIDIAGADLCTASDPARFYSFRRDGATGRMAAFIWRHRC